LYKIPWVGVERLLEKRDVEGEPARKLRKYLVGRSEELWTGVGMGGLAPSNVAEQGLRFHIAGRRRVSGGAAALRVRFGRPPWRAPLRRRGCD
jgi:hypothetical protein